MKAQALVVTIDCGKPGEIDVALKGGVIARAAFEAAIAEKPASRFMIRQRTRACAAHPEGEW